LGYVDLVVVVPCKSHIRFTEYQGLVEFANLRHRQVTCSLHRSDAVRGALEQGHLFYSLSCRPDKMVYDNCSEEYTRAPLHLYQQIADRARKAFGTSYGRAQSFYACACQIKNGEDATIVPFLLHQAAELTYRAVLLSLMEKETHTHSIKALIRHSRRCAPQLTTIFPRDTPEEKRLVHLLEESYLKARYDETHDIDNDTTELLFSRVRRLQHISSQVFEEKLSAYFELYEAHGSSNQ